MEDVHKNLNVSFVKTVTVKAILCSTFWCWNEMPGVVSKDWDLKRAAYVKPKLAITNSRHSAFEYCTA
jgi:hypothetical protein